MTTIFSTFFHTLADFLETPSNELPKTPRYGWIPDVPDRRDDYIPHYPTDSDDEYVVRPPSKPETESETNNDPSSTTLDLRLNMPAIYDDHGLGCSTVSALATLLEFHQLQEDPESDYEPSRLFWYYAIRVLRGTERSDSGASFRDAWKVLNQEGICDEIDWPFQPNMYLAAPYWSCYESESQSTPVVYKRVPHTMDAIKYCLKNNMPIAFGMSIYASFESETTRRTGQVSLPACCRDLKQGNDGSSNEETSDNITKTEEEDVHLGGHALVLVGFNDETNVFIVRNSQGTKWGDNGYAYIPYEYILNPMLCRDFWVLESKSDSVTQEATCETTSSHSQDAGIELPRIFKELIERVRR
jgi:C1A family cysteine protease